MTAAAVLALCACGSQGSPGSTAPAGRSRTNESAPGPKGTVETLAGPGYCSGTSVPIAASKLVGAMTVDSSGPFFFDTGTMSAGSVARGAAGGSPRATPIVHALPRGPDPVIGTRLHVPNATAPSRLASNGSGGFFLAAGNRVLEVDSTNTLVRVIGGERHDPVPSPSDDGSPTPVSQATFSSARTVDTDEAGNLYISDLMDRRNAIVRIRFVNRGRQPVVFYPGTTFEVSIGPDEIGTLAGVPGIGNKGDGGPARLATFQGVPPSIAVAGGKLYLGLYWGIGSTRSGRVRVINLTGEAQSAHGISVAPGHIETIAEGDESGISAKQDDGPRRRFSYMPGMDADDAGNVYLADALGHRILKIDSSGRRSVFAGTGRAGFNGNDRPAASALLNLPYDVKIGSNGTVYISDRLNAQVRSVDGAGTIRAAPGSGVGAEWRCLSPQVSGSSGSPERPQPGNPRSVAADSAGNTYFALPARGQVKKLNRDGSVSRFAGAEEPLAACTKSPCSLVGDGGPAESAGLIEPSSLASRPEGLYVLDSGNLRVHFVNWGPKKVTVHGVSVPPGRIRAIAGMGRRGPSGDGGRALEAELDPALFEKGSLAADASGNLFLGEGGNRRIRRVDAQGMMSTFAGEDGPPALRMCCSDPVAMMVDPRGNLYVADLGRVGPEFDERPRVWLINRSSAPLSAFGQQIGPDRVAPIAGNGEVGVADESVKAVEAPLLKLSGLAISEGRLYVAEIAGFTRKTVDFGPIGSIRSVDRGGILTSVSGSSLFGFNGDGMKAELTSVYPGQLAADPCGNLLIPDEGNDRVRRLNLLGDCALTRPAAERQSSRAIAERAVP